MIVNRIDHVILATPDLAAAAAPYERLGLHLSSEGKHPGLGTANRAFFVGDALSHMYVELLGVHDRAEAEAAGASRAWLLDALAAGPKLARIALRTDDFTGAVARLRAAGLGVTPYTASRADGTKILDVAALPNDSGLGFDVAIVAYDIPVEAQVAARQARGDLATAFPLKRLDHLAALAPDIEGATRRFKELLDVEPFGEVRGTNMVIRQMKIGDAIIELLGPDGPDSPLAGRPPGLSSMCAFEVQGSLEAAIATARERGFTPPDSRVGPLPGTRVTTIPGSELGGMGLQLLEYV